MVGFHHQALAGEEEVCIVATHVMRATFFLDTIFGFELLSI